MVLRKSPYRRMEHRSPWRRWSPVASCPARAQWAWRDDNGRTVYSDRATPRRESPDRHRPPGAEQADGSCRPPCPAQTSAPRPATDAQGDGARGGSGDSARALPSRKWNSASASRSGRTPKEGAGRETKLAAKGRRTRTREGVPPRLGGEASAVEGAASRPPATASFWTNCQQRPPRPSAPASSSARPQLSVSRFRRCARRRVPGAPPGVDRKRPIDPDPIASRTTASSPAARFQIPHAGARGRSSGTRRSQTRALIACSQVAPTRVIDLQHVAGIRNANIDRDDHSFGRRCGSARCTNESISSRR